MRRSCSRKARHISGADLQMAGWQLLLSCQPPNHQHLLHVARLEPCASQAGWLSVLLLESLRREVRHPDRDTNLGPTCGRALSGRHPRAASPTQLRRQCAAVGTAAAERGRRPPDGGWRRLRGAGGAAKMVGWNVAHLLEHGERARSKGVHAVGLQPCIRYMYPVNPMICRNQTKLGSLDRKTASKCGKGWQRLQPHPIWQFTGPPHPSKINY